MENIKIDKEKLKLEYAALSLANEIESFVFNYKPPEDISINDIIWYENIVKETAKSLLEGNFKHIIENLNEIIEKARFDEDMEEYSSNAHELLEKINAFDAENGNKSKGYQLYEAVKYGTVKEVQQLINDGADVNFIYEPYSYGYTPLHMAAYNGDIEKIKLLMVNGASVNALSVLGRTPLALAEERHNIESITDFLKIYGANNALTPMPDFAKVGEVFYTHDDKFLLIAESGKIITFDRLSTSAIVETCNRLNITNESIEIDFSDNEYFSEGVYYTFSFMEYLKNIEAEKSFIKKALPYEVDTQEYPKYKLTLLTEDEAVYINPGDEVLVVDIKKSCVLSEEMGIKRYFSTMNQVINQQKRFILGANFVAYCERNKSFMENLKEKTSDIDWDAASERVQKEVSKSLEKLTGILSVRENIEEDKTENEPIRTDELMLYLKEEFPGVFNNHFTYELVENLVDYAYKTHGHSKGSARAIVCEILPEVDEEELKQFLPDFRASTNKTEASSIEADVIKRRKGGR